MVEKFRATGKGYGRYKSRKLKHFGVDYFKAYIEYNYVPKLLRLGLSRNSNLFFYDDNTYIELGDSEVYTKHSKYFMIKDKDTGITLAFIMIPKVGKVGAIKYNNIYEVTGQGLILRDLKFYFEFLRWAGFKIQKFRRVDVCFDITTDIQYLYDIILKDYLETKTVTPIAKKGKIETIYVGEKQLSKNSYQFIRIYDKIKDSKFKQKEFLYDFEGVDSLTRFEVELRRDRCIRITEKKLLDDLYLFGIIKRTFYHMNYQFFKFLKKEDYIEISKIEKGIHHKRKQVIVKRQNDFIKYGRDFKDEKDEAKTKTMFTNSAKRLYKNGYKREDLLRILKNNGIK